MNYNKKRKMIRNNKWKTHNNKWKTNGTCKDRVSIIFTMQHLLWTFDGIDTNMKDIRLLNHHHNFVIQFMIIVLYRFQIATLTCDIAIRCCITNSSDNLLSRNVGTLYITKGVAV